MSDREKLIELLESAESAFYWNSNDKGFIEKIADHLISNGVTVQKWIPVSERLPEQHEAVIGWDGKFVGEVQHDGRNFVWLDDDGWNETADITHWMPLPEPPKECE